MGIKRNIINKNKLLSILLIQTLVLNAILLIVLPITNNGETSFPDINPIPMKKKVFQNESEYNFEDNIIIKDSIIIDHGTRAPAWQTLLKRPLWAGGLGVVAINNSIYAFGGSTAVGQKFNATHLYNCSTDTWTSRKDIPEKLSGFGIGVCNNKSYIFSGFTYIYDPVKNQWTKKRGMINYRVGAGAAVVNNKIYLIGGFNYSTYKVCSNVECYDTITDTWTIKKPMLTARQDPTISVLNGKIYVMGGYTDGAIRTKIVECFDPFTNTWSRKNNLPGQLAGAGAVSLNGSIYLIGGSPRPSSITNSVKCYNPAANRWYSKESMPTPRSGLGVTHINNYIYAIGGYGGALDEFGNNERYIKDNHRMIIVNKDFKGSEPDFGITKFKIIQNAINASWSGDFISVFPGEYRENLIVNKTVSIMGWGVDRSIINGGNKTCIRIENESYVNISAFTLTTNYNINSNGINFTNRTNNCTIYDVKITNCDNGLYFTNDCEKNIVKYCKLTKNNKGAYLQNKSNSTFQNNWIQNNTIFGIENNDSTILIDAINNWWGKPNGPHHPMRNPNGTGDNVSDYVLFEPWLKMLPGNDAPHIYGIDKNIAIEDEYYKKKYTIYDYNQDKMTWSFKSNASWLELDPENNTLHGTPKNNDVDTFWVNISLDDGNYGYDFRNFTITVTNTIPSILTQDITNAIEDTLYINDYNCDDDGQGNITWYLSTTATWLSLNNTIGILSGIPLNQDVGEHKVNITVHDGNGGYNSTNFTIIVNNTNDAPIIETIDILSANQDELYKVVYTAKEIDVGDILTWSCNTNATWLNWGTINKTLFGTPTNNDIGLYWVRINVSDNNDGFDEHYFEINVNNVNDPPIIITNDVTSVREDNSYEVIYIANDIDPNDKLTWTYSSNASWLNWGESNKTLYGLPTNEDVGEYWINLTVTDNHGAFDNHDFILIVINTNDFPTITTIDITIAYEDKYYEVEYFAIDIDKGDSLNFGYNSNASWLFWDSERNTLHGTPENEDVGIYHIIITVFDSYGGFDKHEFDLTVINTNDPPIIQTEDIIVVNEDEYYFVKYEAIDIDLKDKLRWTQENNADWLSWEPSNHALYGTPGNGDVGKYSVKIKVTDKAGEFDEHNFNLEVINVNDPPVIQDAPTFLEVNAYEEYTLDLTEFVYDIDNKTTELELFIDSKYGIIDGLKITFKYPNSVSTEQVKLYVSDSTDNSKFHYILVKVIPKNILYPEIIRKSPIGIDIDVLTNITVTFNKQMDHLIVENSISILPSIEVRFEWEEDTIIIIPDSILSYNTTYTIKINRNATDFEGFSLTENYSWGFTTSKLDSDKDGSPDDVDEFPDNPYEWVDSDKDGIGNNADPDDDNDGLSDKNELEIGTNPFLKDSDGDGYIDGDDDYPLDNTRWKKESKPQNDNFGMIVLIIFVIIVVVILFLIFFKKRQRSDDGKQIKDQEEKFELKSDSGVPKATTPVISQPVEQKSCQTCGLTMKHYAQNKRYYCSYCKKYD